MKTMIITFKEGTTEEQILELENIITKTKIIKSIDITGQTVVKHSSSGWKHYDQPGQCGLCGSFHCSGNCFK